MESVNALLLHTSLAPPPPPCPPPWPTPPTRARGRRWGGAVWEQQGVHWFHLLGSLKNLTIGLIWLAWGGVGQGGGQGGVDVGGAPESSVGATRRSLVPPLGSLKNLTIGLIWLVTRGGGVGATFWAPTWLVTRGGRRGGCGPGRRARGGRWGGAWARQAGKGA